MSNVEGVKRVQTRLKQLQRKAAADERTASVTVGFTQNYALHVHERKDLRHDVGQAKYLEEPARKLGKTLGNIVSTVYKKTGSIAKGLLVAGLRLQREAQELTPVDTGALKASAFTSLTKNSEQAANTALQKSEAIRKKELAKRKANRQR